MIKVEHLFKSIGNRDIIKDISFEVESGKTLVIIGGSGSGKTTILKLLIGLIRPSSGRIYVDGEDISSYNEDQLDKIRLDMGMVFQYSALFDSMSVFDNVAFGIREHTKLDERDIYEIVQNKLNLVGLADVGNLYPDELSGGMKKRISLARAIANEPRILFYDEPSSGLDPLTSSKIDELIVQMQKVLGVTSIVVTHDMKSAFSIADTILMVHKGEVVTIGTPKEILECPNKTVREFIDCSQFRQKVKK